MGFGAAALLARERRLVGEEVLLPPREINALPKGAGKTDALKVKGYFAPSPHRVAI